MIENGFARRSRRLSPEPSFAAAWLLVLALFGLVGPALAQPSGTEDAVAPVPLTGGPGDATLERILAGEYSRRDAELPVGASIAVDSKAPPDKINEWTILFYDDSDCLVGDPLDDFAANVYSAANLDVVALQDTLWTQARLWHLPGGGEKKLLDNLGELDMGHYATLRDFVLYGKERFPAKRYVLALYDHGGGWKGACVDETADPPSILTMDDFQLALREAGGVDIIAFTAPCLMGAIESAYELRDSVDVYIGAEDLSNWGLWQGGVFLDLCDLLVASRGVSNEEIAAYLVERMSLAELYPWPYYTVGAMATGEVAELGQRVGELGAYLADHIEDLRSGVQAAREATWTLAQDFYPDFDRVDFVSAMESLALFVPDPFVQDKVGEILALYDRALVAEWHWETQVGAHGFSIYFPRLADQYDPTYHASLLDFTDTLSWDDFLRAYHATDAEAEASAGACF